MENTIWIINDDEKQLCRKSIEKALKLGASSVRITMNKSLMDQFLLLNGEIDKVSHSADRSLSLSIFADNKYGTFSTNKLEWNELEQFISTAIDTVKMLEKDICRTLPDSKRTVKNAIKGDELGIFDKEYANLATNDRINIVLNSSNFIKFKESAKDYTLISEEIAYSDSIYDNYITDSNELECRQIETSFEISTEITIQDKAGNKYTGYGWDASTHLKELKPENIGNIALKRALSQINPRTINSGKYNMVVENEIGSKLVSPILSALNGFSIQQKNSFLMDMLNKKCFHEGFTLADKSTEMGKNGSRLFDSEGVAYKNSNVIENGVIKKYFINTYISNKMQVPPTSEDCPRPMIMPYWQDEEKSDINLNDILKKCKKGIFITGFNGGNCNLATGDFSYGAEGFIFEEGELKYPVREMVITGNFIELWNNLIAAGSDYRECMSKQIPTLAFANVDFSG